MSSNTKKMAILYGLAIFFISLDRFAKLYFYNTKDSFQVIKNYLSLQYAENYFIAFSIPINPALIKFATTIIVLGLILYFYSLIKKRDLTLSFVVFILILGSSSNIYDRFKYGFVIDYINLNHFSILNIADIIIFVSILIAIIILQRKSKQKASEH